MGEVFDEVCFEGEDPGIEFRGALLGVRRGDPGWLEVHSEALNLHLEKAAGYGTDEDALANYVETSASVGEPGEYTCWLRIMEKAQRALNMIRSGQADECSEGPDVAGLAYAAEALRRRRV